MTGDWKLRKNGILAFRIVTTLLYLYKVAQGSLEESFAESVIILRSVQ